MASDQGVVEMGERLLEEIGVPLKEKVADEAGDSVEVKELPFEGKKVHFGERQHEYIVASIAYS